VGVMVRLDKFQELTSTALLVAVAVKLWRWPSLSVAPIGIALTTSDWSVLVSPVRPFPVAARVPSAIAEPSVPGVLAPQVMLGASGLTFTASLVVAVVALPSASRTVAVAVRLKFVSVIGVMVRLERFQALTSTEVLPPP